MLLASRIRPLIPHRHHHLLLLRKPLSHSTSISSPPPDANSADPTLRPSLPPDPSPPPSSPPDPPPLQRPSPHHHSLPTFLSYATRTSLSSTSPVYIGTYYEYICLLTLPRIGFTSLTRTGGRADCGIDLLGQWQLPSLPYPLRVLVQCKATKSKPAPERIRELEGALAGAPEGYRGADVTVAVLCAKQAATKGVRDGLRRSGVPVVWVMIDVLGGEGRGRVRQVLWNEKVAAMGAEGVGVGVRYVFAGREEAVAAASSSPHRGGMEKEAVLLWEGREWDPGVKENEEEEKLSSHVAVSAASSI